MWEETMNLKKKLKHLAQKAMSTKNYGKSDSIVKACKDLDGVFIAATPEEAKLTEKHHGVKSYHIDKNLEGIRGPFFFDHKAITKLLNRAADKISALEEQAAFYEIVKEENDRLKEDLAEIRKVTDEEFIRRF